MNFLFITLMILVGTLWVPLLFSLEIQFAETLKYNFKWGPFSLNRFFDFVLKSPTKKTKPKAKEKKSNPPKSEKASRLKPILIRLFLMPDFLWALSQWGFKGLKIFYPMSNPQWPYAKIEFGTGNPFTTSQIHQKLMILGQLSSFKKIDLNPNWTQKKFVFEIKARWILFPGLILLKSFFYIMRFPYYTLIKSLYFASSKQRYESRQKK